jgi:hypothetical protein
LHLLCLYGPFQLGAGLAGQDEQRLQLIGQAESLHHGFQRGSTFAFQLLDD